MIKRRLHRRGTAAVEMAIVLPATLMLILGMVVLGLGIFRFQQVAHAAREGSRWASMHGTQYAADTGKPAATASDVFTQAIQKQTVGMAPGQLSYTVTWNSSNAPTTTKTVGNTTTTVANTVSVTVKYQWVPEAYLGGITLTSTSISTMAY